MSERFLVLGAGGQDGTIAGMLLDSLGEDVHAGIPYTSSQPSPIDGLSPAQRLHAVDILDRARLIELLDEVRPTRILNLAGESNVRASWDHPARTFAVNTTGALNLFEAVIECGLASEVRIYQAISSEVFGVATESPQNEMTPMTPVTPYGASKAAARQSAAMLRERHNLWIAQASSTTTRSIYRPEAVRGPSCDRLGRSDSTRAAVAT
jgi:GDPmannose 4,6-dehydratase